MCRKPFTNVLSLVLCEWGGGGEGGGACKVFLNVIHKSSCSGGVVAITNSTLE